MKSILRKMFFKQVILKINIYFSIVLSASFTNKALASNLYDPSTEPINFKLEAPFTELMTFKPEEGASIKERSVKGILFYEDEKHTLKSLSVKIKLRGWSTLFSCDFKKLKVKFKDGTPLEGPFAGIESFDLGTHCIDPETTHQKDATLKKYLEPMNYNHREALIYQMIRLAGVPGLQSRRAFVKYADTSLKPELGLTDAKTYQAFILEKYDDFLLRENAESIAFVGQLQFSSKPKPNLRYEFTSVSEANNFDKEGLALLALLQSLIGNGDFFISMNPNDLRQGDESTRLWNMKVYEITGGQWRAFANDFNGTSFAVALEGFYYFSDVTKYLVVLPQESQLKLREKLLSLKPEIIKLFTNLKSYDPVGFKTIEKRIQEFYKQLDQKFQPVIVPLQTNR
jgi:hypothetical protein